MGAAAGERATIGQRLAAADAARFVGRRAELERLEALLVDVPERNVVLLHGPGGIGKSTLLRELVRRAEAAGWPSRIIEARDLPEQPRGLQAVLDDLALVAACPGRVRLLGGGRAPHPPPAGPRPARPPRRVGGRDQRPAARRRRRGGRTAGSTSPPSSASGPSPTPTRLACALAHGAADDQAADLVTWARGPAAGDRAGGVHRPPGRRPDLGRRGGTPRAPPPRRLARSPPAARLRRQRPDHHAGDARRGARRRPRRRGLPRGSAASRSPSRSATGSCCTRRSPTPFAG